MNNPQILVLDFGSQYTQLIARRLREYGIYTEIVPYFETLDSIKAKKPKGIILSGGPASVYEEGAYKPDSRIFDLNIPILGICYGMQYIAHFFGGSVVKAEAQEFGRAVLTILNGDSKTYDMESHSTHTNNIESNNIKQITSDTLILREFVSSDLEDVESMLLDSEVMSAWGRALSKQEAKEWLDKQMQSYRKYGFGLFAVVEKSSNEIVGQCGITWQSVQDSNLYDTIKASLSNTDYLNHATQHAMQTLLDSKAPLLPELGYIFKKSHWHKGLASKAAKMCMEYAFKELGLPLLISLIKTDNIAPQNLAKRLEMRIIGKSNKTFDNKDIAHFVYMLKASDYMGLDLNANDSKKVLLEFASYTKNNPMSADTKDELLKIWRDSVHATHHFLKAKDIDEIANDMENLLDSICLESSLTQNLDSTKRTKGGSAEVSLGNFAGCV
ncbi:GNAT family N-acetyltransferase, partial [Helicobacter bilis]|uniref:GNAT family N-acetyltransferase n=1 Tax=Helicobacter bilis TaxID=37372 RepID=UPI00294203C5